MGGSFLPLALISSSLSTMPQPFPSSLTLLTAILTLLLSIPFRSFVHAFQPIPVASPCFAYVEGQGLYVAGGYTKNSTLSQAFVLDLSVSWNTSDPVFRKLKNGPTMNHTPCSMFNNGEDLFVLSQATGYIYNVKSDSWTVLHNNIFMDAYTIAGATDLESGIIYIPNGGMDFSGKRVVLALDMKTGTSSTTAMPPIDIVDLNVISIAWCAYLRSFLFIFQSGLNMHTFTPSNVSESSSGWGTLTTKGIGLSGVQSCFFPAYDGTKMVYFSTDNLQGYVVILDMATLTWKQGPPTTALIYAACAVSGDYFIVWGGETDGQLHIMDTNTNGGDIPGETLVFNLKKGTWTSRYIPPPIPPSPSPTMTPSHILGATQTPAQHIPFTTNIPDYDDQNLVKVIIIVVGVFLAIILTTISVYLGLTKRVDSDTQSAKSDASTPFDIDTDSLSHLGSDGARTLYEHPHTIVKGSTEKRNVQEGAFNTQMTPQSPHAVVEQGFVGHNYKAELESAAHHGAIARHQENQSETTIN